MSRFNIKDSTGFSLSTILIVVFTIVALFGIGIWVYQHNHKSVNSSISNTKTSQGISKATTTLIDPTTTWKIYCDTNSGQCFKYPADWSLSSSSVSGGVSVTVRNSSNTVLVSYTNPFTKDTSAADFYAADIENTTTNSPNFKIVGGVFTASGLPSYYLVNTSSLNAYPLTVGQTSQFQTAGNFTNKTGESKSQLTAYPIGSQYANIEQAKSWFSTPEAQNCMKILKSFYYQ